MHSVSLCMRVYVCVLFLILLSRRNTVKYFSFDKYTIAVWMYTPFSSNIESSISTLYIYQPFLFAYSGKLYFIAYVWLILKPSKQFSFVCRRCTRRRLPCLVVFFYLNFCVQCVSSYTFSFNRIKKNRATTMPMIYMRNEYSLA